MMLVIDRVMMPDVVPLRTRGTVLFSGCGSILPKGTKKTIRPVKCVETLLSLATLLLRLFHGSLGVKLPYHLDFTR